MTASDPQRPAMLVPPRRRSVVRTIAKPPMFLALVILIGSAAASGAGASNGRGPNPGAGGGPKPSHKAPPGHEPPATPAPTVAPTATATPASTSAPIATPAPAPTASTSPASSGRLWGLIGNDGTRLANERSAGVNTKLLELSWSSYEPSDNAFSSSYITAKKNELAALRAAGFQVILSLGYQTAPTWIYSLPNALYVNQYGDTYTDGTHGSGRANVIWNPTIRQQTGAYIDQVFRDFGTSFYAVRFGGGRYGELGYPVASWNGRSNTYWAFDANAAASNPVPGWKPGMASPNGEARRFADWYLNKLVEYERWQLAALRRSYPGRVMLLLPSWGIRPTQLDAAIAANLNGTTSSEANGEVPRGYDFARQVAALSDSNVVLTTTWLNPNRAWVNDTGLDQRYWSPIHYLASLAGPKGLRTFGENTGHDDATDMTYSADQVVRYGLLGMLWYREDELFSGVYANLSDYERTIDLHQ